MKHLRKYNESKNALTTEDLESVCNDIFAELLDSDDIIIKEDDSEEGIQDLFPHISNDLKSGTNYIIIQIIRNPSSKEGRYDRAGFTNILNSDHEFESHINKYEKYLENKIKLELAS